MKLNRSFFLASIFCGIILFVPAYCDAQLAQSLDEKLHHLRIEGAREWSDFPEKAESESLIVKFEATENQTPFAIQMRQQDVKQKWLVHLNGEKLGTLSVDENDMLCYFELPAKILQVGENELEIKQHITKRSSPDDIRVGEIVLHQQPLKEVLSAASVEIEVTNVKTKLLMPARITIVRQDGAMPVLATTSGNHLAIRPGVVYTSTGKAAVSLPAGNYTIFAGRGFEYSVAQKSIKLCGEKLQRVKLSLQREVPTEGYVACDTHVHTFTYSKHGDCEIAERMVTLAGEGIEFPIATDHNLHIDYEPIAKRANVLKYFTPVIGNEVTTKQGHFNIFPVKKEAAIPNYKTESWEETIQEIKKVPGVRVIILNHARDVHSGTRPFGAKLYNEAVGENIKGWKFGTNAMEVINSGATQTDSLQLMRDWMTQLNRGRFLTPVGCSDSHDVNRFIVGQGRTYIRCDDKNPGNIDQKVAVENFLKGKVLVSFGLITEMKINGKFQSGEIASIAKGDDEVSVAIRVLGPHWSGADVIQLYANGQLVREEKIEKRASNEKGVIWTGEWKYKVPSHDVHLVAIASGAGNQDAFWRTAKAYQPTSPHFDSRLLGCSGAIWLDADRDDKKTSAHGYATNLFKKSEGNINRLVASLKNYDAAVAAQVAHLYQTAGNAVISEKCQAALKNGSAETRTGFQNYFEAWRKTVLAQNGK